MLVDEISVGEQVSIALASSGSVPDDLAVGDEVAFRPEGMGFALHTADRSFEVEGRSPEDARTLRRLTGNQIDLIAWIRSTPRQLGKDKRSALFISAIPFPPPKRTSEAFVLEVGDVHEAEIRRFVPRGSSGRGSKGNSGATAELEWLKNDLLLPPAMADQREIDDADSTAPEERSDPAVSRHRMIVSAGHGGALSDAFRIHGRTLSVDVRRGDSGAWEVHRLVRSRSESGALFVLHAPIEISDRTTATVIREEYRSELLGGLDLDGTEAFLKLWDGYQQIEHKSIEERAARLGSVPYLSRRRTPAGDWRFLLKAQARPFFDELGTDALTASAEDPARGGGDQFFGRSSFISRVQRTLEDPPRVDLADPGSANEPPERGFLAPSIRGEQRRLKRRDVARDRLRNLTGPMPQLLYLIEGHPFTAATVREEKPESPAVRAALGGPATHRQREALKAALNTPDICLIQGPPGTGKSTVIAALQARLAEISADPADFSRSTLLSSFQHEAVEHVVAKTRILGLPGLKIGRRFGSGDGARLPAFETWKHETAAAIRTRTSVGEGFHQLQQAKLLRAKMMLPLTPAEQVAGLRQAEAIAPPALAARLAAAAGQIDLSLRAPAEDRWVTHLRQCAMELGEVTTGTSVRLTAAINIVNLLEANGRTVDPALAELAAWSTPDEPDPDLWLHAIEASAAELPSGVHASGAARVPPSEQQLSLLTDLVDELTSELSRSQEGPALIALEFADRLDHDPEGAEEIARRYSAVLAATCQQAASQDLVEIKESSDPVFENVIIDEAARANPLDLLIPMSMGRRRIILVGDHRQLPQMLEPDVEREVRRSIGDEHAERLKQSLFERLFDQLKELEDETGVKRVVTLDTQFRMHRRLADYVSDTFYRADGGLQSHPSTDALTHQISPYNGRVAAWIDVPLSAGAERSARPGWSRPAEATLVAEVVEDVATRAPDLSIGVITFYADQSRLISAELERRGLMYRADDGAWVAQRPGSDEELRVGTVDSFQGTEFDVVILSTVRSNDRTVDSAEDQRRKWGFLTLPNRLCVATSRQRRLLLVVGDPAMARGPATEWAPELSQLRRFCDEEAVRGA